MLMIKYFLPLCAVLLLSSCATAINGPTQVVTVNVKNADAAYARCYLENEDIKKAIEAPATVTIQRSIKPLYAYCVTANGKEASQIVESRLSSKVSWNVLNFYTGLGYDVAARTAYGYPNVIDIDFAAQANSIYESLETPKDYEEVYIEQQREKMKEVVTRARALMSSQ